MASVPVDGSVDGGADSAADAGLDAGHSNWIAIYGLPTVMIQHVIRFAPGESKLNEEDLTTLRAVAEVTIRERFSLEIQGHADPRDKSYKIGARRAKHVLETLVKLGVPRDKLVAKDYAATRPLDPKSKKVNGRVSFLVLERDGAPN